MKPVICWREGDLEVQAGLGWLTLGKGDHVLLRRRGDAATQLAQALGADPSTYSNLYASKVMVWSDARRGSATVSFDNQKIELPADIRCDVARWFAPTAPILTREVADRYRLGGKLVALLSPCELRQLVRDAAALCEERRRLSRAIILLAGSGPLTLEGTTDGQYVARFGVIDVKLSRAELAQVAMEADRFSRRDHESH